jgi:hypothetical protein
MKRLLLVVAFAAGAFALTCGPADAITVTFNDLTETVTATVTDLPAGVTSSTSLAPESATVTIRGATFPANAPTSLFVPLVLTEPPGLTAASDIIVITRVTGGEDEDEDMRAGFRVSFTSDSETGLPLPTNFNALPETPTNNPFITFSGLVVGAATNIPLTINAFSDTPETPDRVPEPTTLLLLGSGLVGVGVLRYRRDRTR